MAGHDAEVDPHAVTGHVSDPAADGHGHADHGDGHDAAHAQATLGPIDWRAWGAGALGGVLAGVIAVALYLTSHPS